MNRKIWLTGSGGFIGRPTARALADPDVELQCFTNRSGSDGPGNGSTPRHRLNFASESDIRRAVDDYGVPDVFVHLAWGAMTDPGSDEHLTANVAAGCCLIDTLFDAGVHRFVFIGSANEYGAREGELVEDMAPVGRLTSYAKAKTIVARHGFAEAAKLGRVFLSVRPFYVYGPGQRSGSLINKLHDCCRQGRKADLGPCEHFRDYVFVQDVADGIRRLCDGGASTIVNIGSGRAIRVHELVRKFWSRFGGRPEDLLFGAHAMRAGEPEQPCCWASQARLKAITDWTPTVTLDEGIRRTVETLNAGS